MEISVLERDSLRDPYAGMRFSWESLYWKKIPLEIPILERDSLGDPLLEGDSLGVEIDYLFRSLYFKEILLQIPIQERDTLGDPYTERGFSWRS